MLNKLMVNLLLAASVVALPVSYASAEVLDEDIEITDTVSDGDDTSDDAAMELQSADAVANYEVDGSLFQQITDLEQEKVLMQLEKERAQLDLELDRLAAEKIKLHMEIDTLSGRAEQQQQELENAKAKLEAETAKLEKQKAALENEDEQPVVKSTRAASADDEKTEVKKVTELFKLVNIFGAGNQLQATVADLTTGQNKKISVGRSIDGYTVKSISLDDGIMFVDPDGNTQTLNVVSGK
ncbi:MAG TPA: type IV pilus biogenesis protein PilP [Alphaproteobacteria bacterium]|nr:type IV pilus biogenesis protein PilP [Alphaproteobacteria bacterium]HBS76703.1 type IV pilus biogenesis protein PilP [Alphaproteobacteria bacterium]